MQQAYRAAGESGSPATTADQVHAGTAVPGPADLRPGDLILIPGSGGTRADPGHVGMYLGSGSSSSPENRRRREDQQTVRVD